MPNTRGYPILRGVPDGMPVYKLPTDYRIPKEYGKLPTISNKVSAAATKGGVCRHGRVMCRHGRG